MALINKGQVMSFDRVVAKIENDIVKVTDKNRCPYFLMNCSDIKLWLEDRSFDTTRGHSRTLRRISQLTNKTEAEISLRFYGATVTDNYWVKTEENLNLTYDEVRFKTDQLFHLALLGDTSDLNHNPEDIMSPQFTVPGNLEKGWNLENGKWYLYKRDNTVEQFNELFVSDISKSLNIPTAVYELTPLGIKTENFAAGKNFEDMQGILMNHEFDYSYAYETIEKLFGSKAAFDYIKLIYVDALCCNTDRHNKNFGILRNQETGEFISLAPNFDFNQSIFGNNVVDVVHTKKPSADLLITDFLKLIKDKNIDYYTIPCLTESDIRHATQREKGSVLYEPAVRYILQRQELIRGDIPPIIPVKGLPPLKEETVEPIKPKIIDAKNKDKGRER